MVVIDRPRDNAAVPARIMSNWITDADCAADLSPGEYLEISANGTPTIVPRRGEYGEVSKGPRTPTKLRGAHGISINPLHHSEDGFRWQMAELQKLRNSQTHFFSFDIQNDAYREMQLENSRLKSVIGRKSSDNKRLEADVARCERRAARYRRLARRIARSSMKSD